ncbi:S8 family serine peptidase [Halorubrum sp. SP9]|uniref:S8 family peptidase n=1 Tax=Halorubrum sp. SP9 TaxID=1537267 RepID=UPI0010F710CC|nr:S8 family serine peptidase [Halorubrum sp. SP9]TKX71337.1 peptidase S8 and S53 subtilisin kexin sedolisin [Halorubrum sp. SP9]
MLLDRRTLLKGIGAAGASVSVAGLASASDGSVEYVVTGKGNGVSDAVADAGFEVFRTVADGEILGVRGPADAESDLSGVAGVSAVSRDVRLDFTEPVDRQVVDPDETDEEPAFAELQWDNRRIDAGEAREFATGEGTSVAVVDTGIDFDHPDLGNVNEDLAATFIPEDASATDGADDEVRGHGTAVAGVVGATGDQGIVGVAPDTELIPVRVFPDEGGARFIDIFAGIDYAAAVGADVANFSLGVPGVLPPQANQGGIRAAIQTVFQSAVRRGTVVTASAGNAGGNLQQGGGFSLPNSVPAAFSVSTTGPNDELVFYSNFGTNEIDVAAPGGGYETLEKTLSTDTPFPFPTNLVFTTYPLERGAYVYIAGTSFSAPQVAGLAALVRELEPNAGPSQVEQAIQQGAELVNGKSDPELGAGRINALNTVESLAKKNGKNKKKKK